MGGVTNCSSGSSKVDRLVCCPVLQVALTHPPPCRCFACLHALRMCERIIGLPATFSSKDNSKYRVSPKKKCIPPPTLCTQKSNFFWFWPTLDTTWWLQLNLTLSFSLKLFKAKERVEDLMWAKTNLPVPGSEAALPNFTQPCSLAPPLNTSVVLEAVLKLPLETLSVS